MNGEEQHNSTDNPDNLSDETGGRFTDKGAEIQLKRTVRVALILIVLMLAITALTNVYLIMLLQLSAQKAKNLIMAVGIGACFVLPVMIFFGLRWGKPAITFGRILSSGKKPSIEEVKETIKGIVRFPMLLAAMMTVAYIIAVTVISYVQYKWFEFSKWEAGAINLSGVIVAFNLGMVIYFATKQLERPQLEKASSILFENGVFSLDHARIPIRYKMFVVFVMVIVYVLISAVLMGFAQVDNVQRSQLRENLMHWVLDETGQDKQLSWNVEFFVMDEEGNAISGTLDSLTEDEIKQIGASKKDGSIVDKRNQKMIVFSPIGAGGLITGATGYWGRTEGIKERTTKLLIVLAVTTLVLCITATYFIASDINYPTSQSLEFLQRVGAGEKTKVLRAYSDDEMGALVGQIVKTTMALEERTSKSQDILETVRQTIKGMERTMEDVRLAGEEQSAGVREQVASVEEALSASSEILATSKQIAENAGDVESAADDNAQACIVGSETISESLSGFEKLNEYVKSISEAAVEASRNFERVAGIVAIIQEIATQVDLLALNAQIEAAAAGTEGLRFNVVAEEVGRLAARTVDAAKEIKELVADVNVSSEKVVTQAEQGLEVVKEGSGLADNVGDTITGIQQLAEKTSEVAKGIVLITRQQTSASEQMAETVQGIHDSAQLILDNTDRVQKSMMTLDQLAGSLTALFKENGDDGDNRESDQI